jgi:hypothetical protein
MATSLAEIRAKLQAAETRNTQNQSVNTDNSTYPHWNIDEGTSARLRFLPDGDEKNSFFWVEKAVIKLPFSGVVGQADSRPVIVQVPCMEMYGKEFSCPVLAEVRPWYKDDSLKEMANKYWKKRSYLYQGFVRENPLTDDKTPENPIRRFIISPQIFTLVKAALMDPELENLPTDYDAGLDFIVSKTSKGGYSDYNTSKWARKETALTSAERDAIEQYGLFKLSDFLPKRPGEVELKVIKEMFEESVAGKEYDPERWGQYYKPAGMRFNADPTAEGGEPAARPATKPSVKPVVAAAAVTATPPWADEEDDAGEPVSVAATAPVVTPAKPSNQRAEDILAMIRNRQKQ